MNEQLNDEQRGLVQAMLKRHGEEREVLEKKIQNLKSRQVQEFYKLRKQINQQLVEKN